MNKKTISMICACAVSLPALGQKAEVDQLRQQLQQTREAFEKAQAEYRRQIDDLTRKLDALSGSAPTNLPPPNAAPSDKALQDAIAADLMAAGTTNLPASAAAAATQAWSPSQPVPVFKAGMSYMNISFDALVDAGWSTAAEPSHELQLGGHDPLNRGFSLRNAEIALDGAVDPYFKGFANIVFALDENNETEVELEEVFGQTTSLPGNLQVKAGQFFAAFGRQNAQHPHQWAFADQPIILNRTLGPDGLRNVGAQLSWLAPLPFYTEALFGIFNGTGETAASFRNRGESDPAGVDRYAGRATVGRGLRHPDDMLYVPRLVSSFDLTDQQTLMTGLSAAFGANDTGNDTRTEIYGADVYWKWKPVNADKGFPFVSWQTEGLYRRYEAGADPSVNLPAEVIRDYGMYSQVMWGFRPRWVTGVRGEWVSGNNTVIDALNIYRGDRTRISPVLTWYPSEFSKLRLQYNYDQGQHYPDQHSIWLQLELLLGAHGAHQF